jgi:hypothetical protein
LSDFYKTRIFSIDFLKILKYQICPVEAKLFYAGSRRNGQMDMRKLEVTYHNFANKSRKKMEDKISKHQLENAEGKN